MNNYTEIRKNKVCSICNHRKKETVWHTDIRVMVCKDCQKNIDKENNKESR